MSVALQQVGRSRCVHLWKPGVPGPGNKTNPPFEFIISVCMSLLCVRDRCRQSRAVVKDACATVRSLPTPSGPSCLPGRSTAP